MNDNHIKNDENNCGNPNDGTGIFLSNRSISWALACILLFCFFIFIAGYFLGKKHVAERFAHKVEQDSLADKISSSIYSMYDSKGVDAEALDASEGSEQSELQEDSSGESIETQEAAFNGESEAGVASQETVVAQEQDVIKKYYAELVGFGSLKAAQAFVNNLHKKGITVEINTRESKTAQGKIITWYQVVTQKVGQETLTPLVAKLKQEERLRGVRIVAC